MFKDILLISSLFLSLINGKNIEHCSKIGEMQNSVNNLPMYSMGLYACLEFPQKQT